MKITIKIKKKMGGHEITANGTMIGIITVKEKKTVDFIGKQFIKRWLLTATINGKDITEHTFRTEAAAVKELNEIVFDIKDEVYNNTHGKK